jgi:hypothetical protein
MRWPSALGFARTELVPALECALALAPGDRFAERCSKR